MRRLLFLSFYFRPDLCAGSFRASALVDALSAQSRGNWEVDVVTTMPNRYNSFHREAAEYESTGNVSIRRIPLPPHESGMRDQVRAFLTFAWRVRQQIRGQQYDAVFATTSRLATGVLGARIANSRGIPLYLDIRDLFADTIQDVLRGSPLRLLLPAIRLAERYALNTATQVNVVSGGFIPYFEERGLGDSVRVFANGIDDEFLDFDYSKPVSSGEEKVLLYAGNVGEGQGLHRVLPALARALRAGWRIRVIGDGGRRRELAAAARQHGLTNLELLKPMPRSALLHQYKQADVLFLHLNDYKALRRVLPSKIFEYAATGKPVLAGATGHAAAFIADHVPNAAIFPPCDAEAAVRGLGRLRLEHTPREEFVRRFARRAIVQDMMDDMLEAFT